MRGYGVQFIRQLLVTIFRTFHQAGRKEFPDMASKRITAFSI